VERLNGGGDLTRSIHVSVLALSANNGEWLITDGQKQSLDE